MSTLYIDVSKAGEYYNENDSEKKLENGRNEYIYDRTDFIISEMIENQKKAEFKQDAIRRTENIIAYYGDRGSGKTTALKNYISRFQNEKKISDNDKIHDKYKNIVSSKFEVLEVFDPTVFNDGDSFIEIFIANLYGNFKRRIRPQTDIALKNSLLRCFSEIFQDLKYLRTDNVKYYDDCENLVKLSCLSTSLDIRERLSKLINYYLEFRNISDGFLIIPIDDMDLNEKYFSKMFDELRKYLNLPKIIIIMANKYEKMYNNVLDKELGENARLLEQNFVSKKDINEYTQDYLNKVIPLNCRIHIKPIDLEDNIILENVNSNVNSKKIIEGTLNKVVAILMLRKIGHMIAMPNNDFHCLINKNLRAVKNLLVLLANMEDIHEIESGGVKLNEAVNKDNLFTFMEWFNNSWVRENLEEDIFKSYQEIINTPLEYLNFVTIQHIKNNNKIHIEVEDSENIEEGGGKSKSWELFYRNLKEIERQDSIYFNFSLGDVLSLMYSKSFSKTAQNEKFYYAIRFYYSSILYKNLIFGKQITEENDTLTKHRDQFDAITGGDFISALGCLINSNYFFMENNKIKYNDIENNYYTKYLPLYIQNRRVGSQDTESNYRQKNPQPYYAKDIYEKNTNVSQYFCSLFLPLYTTQYIEISLKERAFKSDINTDFIQKYKKFNEDKKFIYPIFNIEMLYEVIVSLIISSRNKFRIDDNSNKLKYTYSTLNGIFDEILTDVLKNSKDVNREDKEDKKIVQYYYTRNFAYNDFFDMDDKWKKIDRREFDKNKIKEGEHSTNESEIKKNQIDSKSEERKNKVRDKIKSNLKLELVKKILFDKSNKFIEDTEENKRKWDEFVKEDNLKTIFTDKDVLENEKFKTVSICKNVVFKFLEEMDKK